MMHAFTSRFTQGTGIIMMEEMFFHAIPYLCKSLPLELDPV